MADFTDNTAFIPEVYAKKLARVAKQFTKFIERNCNREWEGEIRNFGDTVRIALPDPAAVTIGNALVGNTDGNRDTARVQLPEIQYGATASKETTLTIDKAKYFSLRFTDIDTAQSQFDILNGYGAIAMQKLGDEKDKQVMVAVINAVVAEAEETNVIGNPDVPAAVTKDNIYDTVVDMQVALQNAGYLNADGFYSFKGNQEEAEYLQAVLTVNPKIYGLMLKSTQLTHPTAAGDQVIERGKKGMMGGFEIDVNTVLNNITATDVAGLAEEANIAIAATKMCCTYANQITKVEKMRDQTQFADLVRGLELYGFKVIHPKAAVVAFLAA